MEGLNFAFCQVIPTADLSMNISLSRNLAVFVGVITPLLETIRRWSTWREDPPSFFDDFLLGGLLLYGAWRVTKDAPSGQRFLVAGWGVALGMVFLSFFSQLRMLREGVVDPAPVPSEWVVVIKGIGFLIVIVGLITSLRTVLVAD
jgi:hypothetical protein